MELKKDWNDHEYCLMKVREDGNTLQYVKNQTPEICLEAVRQNVFSIRYVENQTPELCIEAIKRNGFSFEYIVKQTPELVHVLKKYKTSIYENIKRGKFHIPITITEKEMEEFYEENPHLLLTL